MTRCCSFRARLQCCDQKEASGFMRAWFEMHEGEESCDDVDDDGDVCDDDA